MVGVNEAAEGELIQKRQTQATPFTLHPHPVLRVLSLFSRGACRGSTRRGCSVRGRTVRVPGTRGGRDGFRGTATICPTAGMSADAHGGPAARVWVLDRGGQTCSVAGTCRVCELVFLQGEEKPGLRSINAILLFELRQGPHTLWG